MSEGTFSATIQWLTDIPELYKTKIKSYSQLNAKSTTPQNAVHESDTPLFSASMGRSSLSITLSKELINHELHIELFDLLGRSIMNWDRISSENIIIFPIANIAIGTYLLRLSADGAQYSKMVMVAQ